MSGTRRKSIGKTIADLAETNQRRAAAADARAAHLGGLLAIARHGLRHAMMDLEAHGHNDMARRAETSLQRSDPNAGEDR